MPAAQDQPEELALLQAVLRRDEAAVHSALAAGAPLAAHGVSALHAAALADFGNVVPLLLVSGAELDAPIDFGFSDGIEASKLSSLAPLRLTASQAAALGRWFDARTALGVAVASAAPAAAAALLSAGASLAPRGRHTVFEELVELAKRTAVESGAAAATAGPAAVQQMAGVLLSSGLPPGAPAGGAHKAAADLAYPQPQSGGAGAPQYPPCDWMLQHLLQMHASGQLGAAHAPAVAVVVSALAKRAAREPDVEAVVAQWLTTPAAAGIEARALQLLGCNLLEQGVVGDALSALLVLPGTREALQQHSREQLFDTRSFGNPRSLVAAAAAIGRPEALDAVLAADGAITLNDVNAFAAMREGRSPHGLALLLSRGVPPLPSDVPPGQVVWWSACPVYAVLEGFQHECELIMEDESMKLEGGPGALMPSDDALQELHADALALMDLLADAGYRPVTFRQYREHYGPTARVLPTFYPPTDAPREAAQWELDTTSKWLWRAAQREPWSPAAHALYPPAFQAAARALLLAARRSNRPAGVQPRRPGLRPRRPRAASEAPGQEPPGAAAVGLASLPPDVLLRVLRLAAYPLSAWRPRIQDGRLLEQIRELREMCEN